MGRQPSPGEQGSITCDSYLGRQCHSNYLPFHLLPSTHSIYWVWCPVVWSIHLVSEDQLSWPCPPTEHPQPPHWCSKKGLDSVQSCSAITKHCIINTFLSTNPKHSPVLVTVKKIKSTPAKSSTMGFFSLLVLHNCRYFPSLIGVPPPQC